MIPLVVPLETADDVVSPDVVPSCHFLFACRGRLGVGSVVGLDEELRQAIGMVFFGGGAFGSLVFLFDLGLFDFGFVGGFGLGFGGLEEGSGAYGAGW